MGRSMLPLIRPEAEWMDLYDKKSRSLVYGKVGEDGRLELFDRKSQRVESGEMKGWCAGRRPRIADFGSSSHLASAAIAAPVHSPIA